MTAESAAILPTSCKQVCGAQTTMSTSSWASAARGSRAAVYSSASLTVLFIFQFAAIIGRRAMISSPVLFVRQDCYAGQFLAFYVLQRSPAAGRDVAHLARRDAVHSDRLGLGALLHGLGYHYVHG